MNRSVTLIIASVLLLTICSCSSNSELDKNTVEKVDKAIEANDIKVAAAVLHDWYLEREDKYEHNELVCDRANKVTELALAEDDLASAQIVAKDFLNRGHHEPIGSYNTTLVSNYMLEQGMYEESLEYSQYWSGYYGEKYELDKSYIRAISDVVTYMCKQGKVTQARNFAKQMVSSMNPVYYNSSDPSWESRYVVDWKKEQINVLMQVVDAYK